MTEKNYTCIVCPMSCSITVKEEDGSLTVSGNTCPRGERFARDEFTDPRRMLTTTVQVDHGLLRRLPVISTAELPKNRIADCLKEVYKVRVEAPVKMGDVIICDILGLGADIVAARDIPVK